MARVPMTEWRRGVRLGVDVGTVRIGIALCDPDGILATPLTTIARPAEQDGVSADLSEIHRLVREHSVVEIIIGIPVTLAGTESYAAAAIRQYAARLATVVDPIPILFADERMSTVAAARRLSERGVRGRRQRAVVDQAAAVEILQGWLEAQRRRT
jgi:putative Holliday junction resolvase